MVVSQWQRHASETTAVSIQGAAGLAAHQSAVTTRTPPPFDFSPGRLAPRQIQAFFARQSEKFFVQWYFTPFFARQREKNFRRLFYH